MISFLKKKQGAPDTNAPAAPNVSQVQLVANVRALLDFATSQAIVKIEDKLIERTVKATSVSPQLTADQETELLKVLNELTAIVSPATADSVSAITALVRDSQQRPGFFRQWCLDPLGRRQIFWAIVWVLVTLFPLIFLQCYSLALSSVLDNITKAESALKSDQTDFDQVNLAIKATEENKVPSLVVQRDAAGSRVDQDVLEVNAAYKMLLAMTPWAQEIAGSESSTKTLTKSDMANIEINVRNLTQSVLKALAHYLLPLLYGLLGASVFILRQLLSKLDQWTLTAISVPKLHLRRVLGLLLGAAMGLLFDSDETAVARTGFGLVTLSFIAGYSAEFVFSMLDTIINRAKEAFATRPSYAPVGNAPAGNANPGNASTGKPPAGGAPAEKPPVE